MNINIGWIEKLMRFCFLAIFFFILIFQTGFQNLNALSMDNYQSEIVIEELRLKEVWINAEKKIWESWLSQQNGFLGRQIFWDKKNEEALILVNWQNKKLWKKISMDEVNRVQKQFDEYVKTSLNVDENPFGLIYEGELDKQR